MKTSKSILALFITLFALSSFVNQSDDTRKLLVRKWKPVKMEANGEVEEDDSETDMELKSNGDIYSEGNKVGSWKLKSKKKLLLHIDEDNDEAVMKIEKLTKTELILSMTQGTDYAKIYFKAID
jgi:hypothetical protein